jgi:hypothetical protein
MLSLLLLGLHLRLLRDGRGRRHTTELRRPLRLLRRRRTLDLPHRLLGRLFCGLVGCRGARARILRCLLRPCRLLSLLAPLWRSDSERAQALGWAAC